MEIDKKKCVGCGNCHAVCTMGVVSLFLSWVIGPALMFALAWIFLGDQPAYRTGVIIVGLARCIAMVLVWNDIALGDRERAAVLVVFNALFQVVAYALLGYFYLTVLPGWLGFDTQGFEVGIWEVARTVLIFNTPPSLMDKDPHKGYCIPYGEEAMKSIGETTGAFKPVASDDLACSRRRASSSSTRSS